MNSRPLLPIGPIGMTLGISYQMLDHMRSMLHVNILAMEYPSYGAYTCEKGPDE